MNQQRRQMAAFSATDSFSSNIVTSQSDNKSQRHSLRSSSSSCSTSQHVDFKETDTVDVNEKQREKHLTAKYPKHQMGLIRKRLAVEDWIDTELKNLFDITDDNYDTYDATLDLDEVLNYDTDPERAAYIREKISRATKPESVLQKFTAELLVKAATL